MRLLRNKIVGLSFLTTVTQTAIKGARSGEGKFDLFVNSLFEKFDIADLQISGFAWLA